MSNDADLVFGWRTALLLFASLQLLVAAALLLRKPVERLSNRLLAAFLLALIAGLIPQMIGFAGFYDAFRWLQFAPFDVTLLYGPLIYAYAGALTLGRLPWPGAWLFAPGALQFAYYCVLFLLPYETKIDWRTTVHRPFVQPVEDATTLMFGVAALLACLRLRRRYADWLENRTSAKASYDAPWFAWYLLTMAGLFALGAMFEVWGMLSGGLSYQQGYWLWLAAGVVSFALAAAALARIRADFPKMPDPVAEPTEPSARDWAADAATLRNRILAEGWHLEPELSLPELARRIGTNETYLSRTVNIGAGENFNRFVNRMRVDAAQDALSRPDSGDILGIAFQCGFNSKATFNRVFRELAGETPRAFRRKSQNP